MRSDIFGECKRRIDDILIQKVNIVALGVGRVVVKREISRKHGILYHHVSKEYYLTGVRGSAKPKYSHQNNATTPDIDLPASVQRVAHY